MTKVPVRPRVLLGLLTGGKDRFIFMKAMVLAAGIGSRLGELTQARPKCLMDIGGTTILGHVLSRLRDAGVSEVVINLFHLPEQIKSYLAATPFHLTVSFSEEGELLGTGGGLQRAEPFFNDGAPFFVYNADIYSEVDLKALEVRHRRSGAVGTLAVMERREASYLLFEADRLAGWRKEGGETTLAKASTNPRALAFCGVQMLSADIFKHMRKQTPPFSLIQSYLKAVQAGAVIQPFVTADREWTDIGTPEQLEKLRQRRDLGSRY